MDAVTLTVVRNAISDVASEMDITLESMAFSPVISEARDRSSGIYNASDGSIIAQGVEAMPFFVSTMEFTVRSCLSLLDDLGPADVIITNPTHFAVALRYRPGEDKAPIVVAKGMDNLALHIRTVARRHQVPIVENRPVARALYRRG